MNVPLPMLKRKWTFCDWQWWRLINDVVNLLIAKMEIVHRRKERTRMKPKNGMRKTCCESYSSEYKQIREVCCFQSVTQWDFLWGINLWNRQPPMICATHTPAQSAKKSSQSPLRLVVIVSCNTSITPPKPAVATPMMKKRVQKLRWRCFLPALSHHKISASPKKKMKWTILSILSTPDNCVWGTVIRQKVRIIKLNISVSR